MKRTLVSSLPQPIAQALQAFLDEDLPRSADEISELLVALIEYLGAVALADYLDGHSDPQQCAPDASLNGWLISQLATGKAEAGLWARWTQIAVQNTVDSQVPGLATYVAANDLDDPESDLAWLLRFRNDVMHGGFVAPLPRIRLALVRMERIFALLEPLWGLVPVGCVAAAPDSTWKELVGLGSSVVDPPRISREDWHGEAGAVLLMDGSHRAILALHPACWTDAEGHLHLQHDWKKQHREWFERPAQIRSFFDRYRQEREARIDAVPWVQAVDEALPAGGRVARPSLESQLVEALEQPGIVLRLVGPVGSGRSTAVRALSEWTGRPVHVLPVEDPSVRMDPAVVRRWVGLSLEALGEEPGILVIDDADRIGSGLYTESSTTGCLAEARARGIPVVLVHRPSGEPPVTGDVMIEVTPWSLEELAEWGDAKSLQTRSGGHPALMVDRAAGIDSLRRRLERVLAGDPVGRSCLDALLPGVATALEVADRTGEFSPGVELSLRRLRDHLVEGQRALEGQATERTYALHPASRITLEGSR